jgi:hypothetical protein
VAIGECGFNGFRYEVEKEGEEGESVEHCLMRGEYRRYEWCFASSTVEHERAPHGGARRGSASQAEGGSGDLCGRRPPGGPEWATQANRPARPVQGFLVGIGRMVQWAELGQKGRTDWALRCPSR